MVKHLVIGCGTEREEEMFDIFKGFYSSINHLQGFWSWVRNPIFYVTFQKCGTFFERKLVPGIFCKCRKIGKIHILTDNVTGNIYHKK